MNPQRWQQVKGIFEQALEHAADQRTAFLEAACSGDAELRREVESLLAADAESDSAFDRPIFDLRPDSTPPTRVGSRIGPYELIEKIGRGGFGTVYLADRVGEFRHRVAVKLIQRGMSSPEAVHRFELERQILADLDHPHVARLFDGGTTEDGSPYLVMEWVEGERLDRYCDAERLSVEARLRLFLEICSAVQFAHHRLVVHRDLKPANVLVTADGVKLLDFGIAKLLGTADKP
ncbi:MAG: serine/threonine-protein kinase, partial [Thermoanaerobaculia bacterium]